MQSFSIYILFTSRLLWLSSPYNMALTICYTVHLQQGLPLNPSAYKKNAKNKPNWLNNSEQPIFWNIKDNNTTRAHTKHNKSTEIITFHMQSLNLVLLLFLFSSIFHVMSLLYTHRTTCKFIKTCHRYDIPVGQEPSDVVPIQFIANYFANYALVHVLVIISIILGNK